MPSVFLISDTHFGHEKTCTVFKREDGSPLRIFKDVDHMNEYMVMQHNRVVKSSDKPEAAPAQDAAPATTAAAPAATASPAPAKSTTNKGDIAWMLMSTALVLMMSIPALALFYGGMVRAKNMLSVLMQVFVVFSLITVLWCVYGYSLAFTEGNAFIGGGQDAQQIAVAAGLETLGPALVEAVTRALQDGQNGYVPSAGIAPAREAVAAEYVRRGMPVTADRVVITEGTSEIQRLVIARAISGIHIP